ncbi:PIN domain-containing protein [Extensimonas vulgaris]|uniref:Ribonuclease VapC n=1 Tax=Extensimonas vulgaris TaxID=1031594 RepID=A0A369ARC4_9BURK|nr:PIN domain-containing protein [Extensimonas vulgaris]RCX11563.1 putative nucleic acid-binding protein [Extensimonas vulgaris]TWI40458.1 putative nucleic acid-binding protein [Extensimonas vulgaris]
MICFIDTNVLVYAVDASDRLRQETALARIAQASARDTVVLSTQVLQEFYQITTRKLRPPLPATEALQQLERLSAFYVMGSTAQSVLAAAQLAERYQLQWWDALILESALRANADLLLTEDGQHGQRFGKLVVENPFL